MRHWLQNFMANRYGVDALGHTLIGTAVALSAVNLLLRWQWLHLISCILLVWELSRMFSRNLNKRWAENRKFTSVFRRTSQNMATRQELLRQSKDYKFFQCPGCKNRLRVPRGKGKIQITCPRCGQRFSGKT